MLHMTSRVLLFVFLVLGAGTAHAQEEQFASPLAAAANEAAGIKLPSPFAVKPGAQFVDIQADTQGTAQFLVLSTTDSVKYKVRAGVPNEITVGIPPKGGVIVVYAIAVVDGKLTKFVRTDITVEGAPGPGPNHLPDPPGPPASGPRYVTVVEDASQRTQELAAILDSPTLGKQLPSPNYILKLLSAKSPVVAAKGLQKEIDKAAKQYGQQPAWLIVQTATGEVRAVVPVPKTEKEFIQAVINAR